PQMTTCEVFNNMTGYIMLKAAIYPESRSPSIIATLRRGDGGRGRRLLEVGKQENSTSGSKAVTACQQPFACFCRRSPFHVNASYHQLTAKEPTALDGAIVHPIAETPISLAAASACLLPTEAAHCKIKVAAFTTITTTNLTPTPS